MRIIHLIVAIIATAGLVRAQIGNIVVTEAASFQTGWPWPGSIASVFCTGLTGISGIVTAGNYPLPLELGGGFGCASAASSRRSLPSRSLTYTSRSTSKYPWKQALYPWG